MGADLRPVGKAHSGDSGRVPQARILVLSASVLEAERDAALDAGGDHLLAKPYLPGELQRACMRLLA